MAIHKIMLLLKNQRIPASIMYTQYLSLILLPLLLLSIININIMMVDGQGMIAIPSPPPDSESSANLPLSKEKVEIHKKIASAAVEKKNKIESGDSNDNSGDGDDDENSATVALDEEKEKIVSSKIIRKDKEKQFQNPQKHQSDEWLLHFLLEQYSLSETSDSNVEEQVDILQNLEHFSHKFENGRDLFQSTNALKRILLPALNSSYPEIRKAACGVFAVAAQNNAVVQKISMENGVCRRLVHLLTFDLASVRSRALYALASLLRNYPEAQIKFIQDGGLSAVVKAASLSETRKRSLNFITDLLLERKYCRSGHEQNGDESESSESSSSNNSNNNTNGTNDVVDACDHERVLEKSLQASGWCDILSDSLENIALFDTDDQALITEATSAAMNFCSEGVSKHAFILHKLLIKFEQDEESSNTALLIQAILHIIDPLSLASPKIVKEEL